MFRPLSLFVGLRYVRSKNSNGFSSFISASSTLGIALGVMVLILVLSAMNGFERELAKRLLSIVPHGEFIAVNGVINDWQPDLKHIVSKDQITGAAPVIKMPGMILNGQEAKGLEIRGVDLNLEKTVSSIADYIVEGEWQALNSPDSIIIGAGIAKLISVKLGDRVQILLPRQNDSQHLSAPISKMVTIVGIFKFGGVIDDGQAYMELTSAAKTVEMINASGEVLIHGIRISVDDVYQAPKIARNVANELSFYAYVYNWTVSQGHLFSDIQLVRMVMYIVLILVIAVASFNIVSTLMMAVNEKRGDIAILKTMGASRATIMCSFIYQGLVNGVLGCVLGGVCGVLLATNLTDIARFFEQLFGSKMLQADVYFIDFIPTQLETNDVVVTVTIGLVLSLMATIYPSWQATKIQPAQVLGQC